MTDIFFYLGMAFIILGFFFTSVAVIGLIRFPDLYTRAHATSKADTLGSVLTLSGIALLFDLNFVKVTFLLLFLFISSPTASHAITRAAYDQGIVPWEKEEDNK